jgi:hypothetical protein
LVLPRKTLSITTQSFGFPVNSKDWGRVSDREVVIVCEYTHSMKLPTSQRLGNWKRRGSAGFTMMEAALTVAIVLILLAFGIPSLFGAVDSFRLTAAVDAATWAIQGARYQAIMKG